MRAFLLALLGATALAVREHGDGGHGHTDADHGHVDTKEIEADLDDWDMEEGGECWVDEDDEEWETCDSWGPGHYSMWDDDWSWSEYWDDEEDTWGYIECYEDECWGEDYDFHEDGSYSMSGWHGDWEVSAECDEDAWCVADDGFEGWQWCHEAYEPEDDCMDFDWEDFEDFDFDEEDWEDWEDWE